MDQTFWRKHLSDGSKEYGFDGQIADGTASWTRGRQDIVCARVTYGGATIEIDCEPVAGRYAEWQQLDNMSVSFATGTHTRLSRELRCSTNGYSKLLITHDMAGIHNINRYLLNNEVGDPVPPGASYLVCRVTRDGTVGYKWS